MVMPYLASSSFDTMDMVDLVVTPWAWLTLLSYHGHGWHDFHTMDMVIIVEHVGARCQYCLTYLAWPYLVMVDIEFIDHSFPVYNAWRDSHGWPASMVAMFVMVDWVVMVELVVILSCHDRPSWHTYLSCLAWLVECYQTSLEHEVLL